ncbi:hypothetical protein ABZS99_42630 [Streptomyces sp. NPDC005463]
MCRPIAQTVADTWSWFTSGSRPVEHPRWDDHGIDPDKERGIVAELR